MISRDFLRLAENFLSMSTFWCVVVLVPVAALVADVCVIFVRRWEFPTLEHMLREKQIVVERARHLMKLSGELPKVDDEELFPLQEMDSANEDVSVCFVVYTSLTRCTCVGIERFHNYETIE